MFKFLLRLVDDATRAKTFLEAASVCKKYFDVMEKLEMQSEKSAYFWMFCSIVFLSRKAIVRSGLAACSLIHLSCLLP